MESGQKSRAPGEPDPAEEAEPKERYGASYLAIDAAQRKAARDTPKPRRRASGRGKWILLLLVIASGTIYFQRARILPWLAQNPRTAPIIQAFQSRLQPATINDRIPLTSLASPTPTGGETTFSAGPGFGTVSPDDGSDTFRVVVPPDTETNR